MPLLTQQQNNWFKQKLKGDFAEAICGTHFNSLGYHVEKIGIEAIAPIYTRKSNSYKQNFVQDQLNKTPDFLISNDSDAFFVEVKFRSIIKNKNTNFYEESAKLMSQYKNIILKPEFTNDINDSMKCKEVYGYIRLGNKLQEKTKVIFYVVLPQRIRGSYVHLFLPQLITTKAYGWRNCTHRDIDHLFGIEGLKERYETLIDPFLETIFDNQHS